MLLVKVPYMVNYYQFITLKFISGLLWVTGLWTMGVMSDGTLHPLPHPLGLLVQSVTIQQKKDTNVRRI
jgi:membrane protein DedA with SNARE-associated domain